MSLFAGSSGMRLLRRQLAKRVVANWPSRATAIAALAALTAVAAFAAPVSG